MTQTNVRKNIDGLHNARKSRVKQLAIAAGAGFRVESFFPHGTRLGKVLSRLPLVRNSIVTDIFSTGASAYLRKTSGSPEPRPAKHTGSEP